MAEFGDKIECRVYTSIYQWDVVQKHGILDRPTVIVNERIRLTEITEEGLRLAIRDICAKT